MSELKILKSIDIGSATIIGTGIQTLFAIILAIIILIMAAAINMSTVGPFLSIASTIIFGSIAFSIFGYFTESYIYNWLAKRIKPISFSIDDDGVIEEVSTTSTAINLAIISTVMVIITYLMSVFIVPIILSTLMQTMVFAGQMQLATSLYSVVMMYTNPLMVITLILGVFIVTLIYVLLGTYIYNLLAARGYGIKVDLNEDQMTSLESIDVKSITLMWGLISLIFGLISGILSAVAAGDMTYIVGNTIFGFISGLIAMALTAIFYNFLSNKLGKLKIELVNE